MEQLVSVIIPTYNRAKLISQSLRSVLSQTYCNFEIIVVDDGSSDNTKEVVESIHDKRIVYLSFDTNRGAAAARNYGIKSAKGEFIAFLDSDDDWLPEKLEKQLNLFSTLDHSYGVVYSGFTVFRDKYKIKESIVPQYQGDLFPAILVKNIVGTFSVVVIRKNYLLEVGGVDESLKSCQDWDLYIRLSKVCKFAFVQEPLVNFYMTNSLFRISNRKSSVVSGYQHLFKKNEREIYLLSAEDRAAYLLGIGKVYLEVGDIRLGFLRISQSFFAARSPEYLKKSLGTLIKGLAIMFKRRLCQFLNFINP